VYYGSGEEQGDLGTREGWKEEVGVGRDEGKGGTTEGPVDVSRPAGKARGPRDPGDKVG